jgi:hypothetical protein
MALLAALSAGAVTSCASDPWISVAKLPPIRFADAAAGRLRVHTFAMLFRPFEAGEREQLLATSSWTYWASNRNEEGEALLLMEDRPGHVIGSGEYYLDVEFDRGGVLRFQHCPRLFGFDEFMMNCEPGTERFVDYHGKRFRVLYDWGLRADSGDLDRLAHGRK